MNMTPAQQQAYDRAREKILDGVRRMEAGEQVVELNLSNMGLVELPPEIGQLRALETLVLHFNELTALPPEIGQLTNLTTLHLQGNRLAAVAKEILQLPKLEALVLSNNQLQVMPQELWQHPTLQKLWLGSNGLKVLPPEVQRLTTLKFLRLEQNHLTTVPPEIGQLTALEVLRLDDNELITLPPEIGQLKALRELYLDKNKLTALPESLRDLPLLRELYLQENDTLGLPPEVLGKHWQEVGSNKEMAADPRAILDYYFRNRLDQSPSPTPEPTPSDIPVIAGSGQAAEHVLRDQACVVDWMRRGALVSALGEFLCAEESDPPLTVTIEAPWGEGKSSVLLQLREWLQKKQGTTCRTVWFNPWRYQTADGVWSGFLSEFTAQMEAGLGLTRRWLLHVRYALAMHEAWPIVGAGLALIFAAVMYWLRGWLFSGGWSEVVFHLVAWGPLLLLLVKLRLAFWKPVRSFASELRRYVKKPDYAAGRDASERLHREFRAWLHACTRGGQRVFVFIDDLDRCPGPRAAELLEWLQLMMSNAGEAQNTKMHQKKQKRNAGPQKEPEDFPLVVIAGLDREKVAASVAMRHGQALNLLAGARTQREKAESAVKWGYEYLEKFIDLPVRLPPGSVGVLEGYLKKLAPKAYAAEDDEKRRRAEEARREWERRERQQQETGGSVRRVAPNPWPRPEEENVKPDEEAHSPQTREKLLEDPGIPDLLRGASVLLRYSPRRAKHFLNLLRLRWAIRQKMGPDRMTLQLTARLALLEVARPTLFRTLADHREVRREIFRRPSEEEDGVFDPNGRWLERSLPELFAADKLWLKENGADIVLADWEDVRLRAEDEFYPGPNPEEARTPPLTLGALEALLEGSRY
jgi:hypothetical protein